MMEHSYSSLNRAQLSFDYLHTNSTTHEFLFGAVAELIDNSRDAGATELDIYAIKDDSLRGGYMLCFADNGCGMSTDETRSVIIFGRSLKRNAESGSIGMYGNGLKSGSMRIGNDMILFTKKDGLMTCLFLSRTFHEEEKIDEVVVPLPAFRGAEKTPVLEGNDDRKKHELEMSIIMQYSPFKCQKDFFSQFDKIKGPSGTLVIIFNMKLLDNGEPELDINSDQKDILLTHPDLLDNAGTDVDVELVDERRSLRAYVSILYADPRMKVYLQGRKVQTKRLISTLYNRRMYNYASKTFKTRAEVDVAKAKEDMKIAELRAKEAESKARDLEARFGNNLDADQLRAVRKARNSAMESREYVKQRQNALMRKQRALKDPKTLTFYFGLNLENRAADGMFVYNCSRLIKMYQRIGPQQDSGMTCRGVVGVVNVPYLVLEPTHNKQDFADAKEFRALMRAMADHLMQYWDDIRLDECDLDEFWGKFGYLSAKWRDLPSSDEVFVRRRAMNVKPCVQCDQCLKWRILPYQQKRLGQDVPDGWQCKDNPDPRHKRCSEPEEQLDIPMGVLKRKIKTKEQRQQELEEQIRRKQKELEQVKKISRDMSVDDDFSDKPKASSSNGPAAKKSTPVVTRPSRQQKKSSSEDESEEEEKTPPPRRSDSAPARRVSAPPPLCKKSGAPLGPKPSATVKPSPQAPVNNKAKQTPAAPAPAPAPPPPTPPTRATNNSTSRKRVLSSESSEEEEVAPVKGAKGGPALKKSPAVTTSDLAATLAPSKRASSSTPNGTEAPPAKKTATEPSIATRSVSNGGAAGDGKVPAKDSGTPTAKDSQRSEAPDSGDTSLLDRLVEVRVQKQMMKGKVVEVRDARVRVRFDNMPDAIHDRWFAHNSADVTFLDVGSNPPTVPPPTSAAPAVGASASASVSAAVAESSTTSVLSSADQLRILDNFRNTLRYFLPPDWPVNKESISRLTAVQLAEFPMEQFFDRYEHGLRQLFTNLQTEAAQAREKLNTAHTLMKKTLVHAENKEEYNSLSADELVEKYDEWLQKETS